MDAQNLTLKTLLMFHSNIKQALIIDDNVAVDQMKVYEVRENPDFRVWADTIEQELDNRAIVYPKIKW